MVVIEFASRESLREFDVKIRSPRHQSVDIPLIATTIGRQQSDDLINCCVAESRSKEFVSVCIVRS
jgi:hypothetical protein